MERHFERASVALQEKNPEIGTAVALCFTHE
jgi:hypothetical protein